MPWAHFEYISVASRNHTRDECTASAVGGHEVSRTDNDGEITVGVDVTAAAIPVQLGNVNVDEPSANSPVASGNSTFVTETQSSVTRSPP